MGHTPYNAPPPNLMHGIQLVQAGHHAEALPYLRYAAQNETLTAEGWLWLAAATNNLDEYRSCVQQALHLDPYHPVALRMRNALDTQSAPAQAPYRQPSYDTPREAAAPVPRRTPLWRRALRVIVVALLLGGCIGVSTSLIASGAITELVRDWLAVEDLHTLDFTLGDEPDYRFRVDVPETWQPANTDSAAWLDTRAELIDTFPATRDLWAALDEPFSTIVRDPTYGTIMPLPRVVETGADDLRDAGMVPTLTLHEIVPLPDAVADAGDGICARMRALETQFVASGGYASIPGGTVLDTTLDERGSFDDCVFAVERRYEDLQPDQIPMALSAEVAPDATREIVIAVPVGSVRFAVWQILYPDAMHDDYDYAVERVRETLVYVP